MRRLINDTSVTFYRPPEDVSADEYGDMPSTSIQQAEGVSTKGSLQPYNRGDETSVLPEGRKSVDARIYITKTKLHTSNDSIEPDFCIINGHKFIVFDSADATTTNILKRVRNYEYVLLQDDSEGSDSLIQVDNGIWQQGTWTFSGIWDNNEIWGV